MPRNRVLVHGTNFTSRRWLLFRRRLGFYTTCYVEAASVAEAERSALAGVRDDPKLILASVTPPRVEVEEIEEIASFDGCVLPRTGAAFYPV